MYNHAPDDYICPFCQLAQRSKDGDSLSRQTDVVYQDEFVTAFIGLFQWPNNPGNVIIIPNQHFENIYDLPIHFAAKIQELAQAIAIAMKAAFACDGVSTRQHNEPAGNQEVWHYHLHVTPRYVGDNFYVTWRADMPAPQRAQLARQLRAYLAEWRPTS